jgi:hypothetical protein
MPRFKKVELVNETNMTYPSTYDKYFVGNLKQLAYQFIWNANLPSAKTFAPADVTVLANTITEVGHGFYTGLVVQLTTVTTLPGGLALLTDYYVIRVDADTYKLAASLVDALAGTPKDITDQGTGNHTTTPVALTACTVKLQKSIDGTTDSWVDVASAQALTTDAVYLPTAVDVGYKWVKPVVAMTAGMGDLKVLVSGIAEFN